MLYPSVLVIDVRMDKYNKIDGSLAYIADIVKDSQQRTAEIILYYLLQWDRVDGIAAARVGENWTFYF